MLSFIKIIIAKRNIQCYSKINDYIFNHHFRFIMRSKFCNLNADILFFQEILNDKYILSKDYQTIF